MTHEAVSTDGIRIPYEVHGAGEPALVFVHGWSCDRSYWRHQLTHFAERYRVVAIDLAGHGESGAGRQSWSMSAFGEDVLAVIEKLELEDVVLVGHSMGGDVIVEVAVRQPDRVAGLVWVDVYRSLKEPHTREELEAFVAPFRENFAPAVLNFVRRMFPPGADPDLAEWVVVDMSSAPPEIALEMMEAAIGNDGAIIAALPKLTAPVVAINPDYRPTDVDGLRSRGVEAVVMPGVGHFLMLEDPAGFNRLLGKAIDGFGR